MEPPRGLSGQAGRPARRRLCEPHRAAVPGLPRSWGEAVGCFGYDVVRRIERLPVRIEREMTAA